MAFNYTVVKTKLGAQWAVPAVKDLPSVKQVACSVDIDFSTLAFISGDTVPVIPVAAGFIVNKVYVVIMTTCTASLTAQVGSYYVTETSAMPGTTLTLGNVSAFGSVALDATAQSVTVPGKPAKATLEATDTSAGAGVYFPVDGFIGLLFGGAEPIVGKIRVVAEMIDAGRIS